MGFLNFVFVTMYAKSERKMIKEPVWNFCSQRIWKKLCGRN